MAATKAFGIIRHACGWKLIAPRHSQRNFKFKVDAEEAALRLAKKAAGRGEVVGVLVQGDYGEMTELSDPRVEPKPKTSR
jgi:hypothetical protein